MGLNKKEKTKKSQFPQSEAEQLCGLQMDSLVARGGLTFPPNSPTGTLAQTVETGEHLSRGQ